MTANADPLKGIRELGDIEKERLLAAIAERAGSNEISYWGCSQAVVDSLQAHFKIGGVEVFRAATAFAGGIASNHEACGALIGGVMAIGLAYGRTAYVPGKVGVEQADLVECSARARKFCDMFRKEFGGLRCSEVRAAMGFDPNAQASKMTVQAFRDHDRCGHVAGRAARLAAEVMLEPPALYQAQVKASADMMSDLRKLMAEQETSE